MGENSVEEDFYSLLDEEEKLLEEEVGYYQIVELYKKMLQLIKEDKALESQNKSYIKKKLVDVLIKHGAFIKSAEVRDDRVAIHSFRDAIRLDAKNPIAHYRLAHLCFRNEQYKEAKKHFENSKKYNETYENVAYKLNEQQHVHAYLYSHHCTLKIAYKEVNEMLEKFPTSVGSIEAEDSLKRQQEQLVDLLRNQVLESEEILAREEYTITTRDSKPYFCSSDDILDIIFLPNSYIFNFADRELIVKYDGAGVTSIGPKKDIKIIVVSQKTAQILKYLLQNPQQISSYELARKIDIKANTITRSIARLNEKIQCLNYPALIETTRQGYCLLKDNSIYMIEKTNDEISIE